VRALTRANLFAALLLGGALLLALAIGPASIDPVGLIRSLADPRASGHSAARALLVDLRLPRALLAAATGAALAVSGVLLQAYFQNPMAGPYVIGVSSGAGLAVAGLAVAIPNAPSGAQPLAAMVGGVGVVLVVTSLAGRMRSGRTETLLLIGLAVAAVCSAITSVILLLLPRGPEGVLFWLMGTMTGATWGGVSQVAVGLLIGGGLGLWKSRDLDAILWGDETASSVGVDVTRTRGILLAATTIPVAVSVAHCGVIGFLGLMVPHLARGLVGSTHGRLLPVSAMLGAAWLVLADLLARMLLAPAELPVGAITSAIGAPFLIWICMRRKR